MIKVTIVGPREIDGEKSVDVKMPVVPRVGEYLSHDAAEISGTVRAVQYWWPEDGKALVIEVRVR